MELSEVKSTSVTPYRLRVCAADRKCLNRETPVESMCVATPGLHDNPGSLVIQLLAQSDQHFDSVPDTYNIRQIIAASHVCLASRFCRTC